jgi:hypothetical protein
MQALCVASKLLLLLKNSFVCQKFVRVQSIVANVAVAAVL